jgi:hypothetical protein
VLDISTTDVAAPSLLALFGEQGRESLMESPIHEFGDDEHEYHCSLFPEAVFGGGVTISPFTKEVEERLYQMRINEAAAKAPK